MSTLQATKRKKQAEQLAKAKRTITNKSVTLRSTINHRKLEALQQRHKESDGSSAEGKYQDFDVSSDDKKGNNVLVSQTKLYLLKCSQMKYKQTTRLLDDPS